LPPYPAAFLNHSFGGGSQLNYLAFHAIPGLFGPLPGSKAADFGWGRVNGALGRVLTHPAPPRPCGEVPQKLNVINLFRATKSCAIFLLFR